MNKFLEYILAFKVLTLNSTRTTPSGCSGCLVSSKFLTSIGGIFVIGALIYFLGLGDMISGILHFFDKGPSAILNNNPGRNWTKISMDTRIDFNNIYFLNSETGWAIGNTDAFYKTEKNGIWEKQSLPIEEYWHFMKFFDEKNGILLGGKKFLYTNDGGKEWNLKKSEIKTEWGIRNAFFVNERKGWVIDWNDCEYVFKTSNAGNSWIKQNTKSKHDTRDLYFANDNTGWVACEDGYILHTSNGGNKWTSTFTGVTKDLNAVYFIDFLTGWVVGNDVTIIKTTDGGINWMIISTYEKSVAEGMSRSSQLKDIKFLNANTGWTVGADGTIFSSTDGGNNWLKDNSKGYKELNKIFILDEKNIWIAAGEGTVYKLEHNK
ncbi:MAG: YCF48-related protein [Ignavibacteriae bacterium]|nr:YCF48-related protein [Ignavibacteriota bacterium]